MQSPNPGHDARTLTTIALHSTILGSIKMLQQHYGNDFPSLMAVSGANTSNLIGDAGSLIGGAAHDFTNDVINPIRRDVVDKIGSVGTQMLQGSTLGSHVSSSVSALVQEPQHVFRYLMDVQARHGNLAMVKAAAPAIVGLAGLAIGALAAPETGGASLDAAASADSALLGADVAESSSILPTAARTAGQIAGAATKAVGQGLATYMKLGGIANAAIGAAGELGNVTHIDNGPLYGSSWARTASHNYTLNGQPVSLGRTVAQSTVGYGPYYNLVSGAVDALFALTAPDPLTAAGELGGLATGSEGMSVVGKRLPGYSFNSESSLQALIDSPVRGAPVRNLFQTLADSTSGEITTMLGGDLTPLAHELGQARTAEEVQQVFLDAMRGTDHLTSEVGPRINPITQLPLDNADQVAQETAADMAAKGPLTEQQRRMAALSFGAQIPKMGLREDVLSALRESRLGRMGTRIGATVDSQGHLITSTFDPKDVYSIRALGSYLRASGESLPVVKHVLTALHDAQNIGDPVLADQAFRQVWSNALTNHLMGSLFKSKIDPEVLATLTSRVREAVNNLVFQNAPIGETEFGTDMFGNDVSSALITPTKDRQAFTQGLTDNAAAAPDPVKALSEIPNLETGAGRFALFPHQMARPTLLNLRRLKQLAEEASGYSEYLKTPNSIRYTRNIGWFLDDQINKKIFQPLVLASISTIERIATSELLPLMFREGPGAVGASMLAKVVARDHIVRAALASAPEDEQIIKEAAKTLGVLHNAVTYFGEGFLKGYSREDLLQNALRIHAMNNGFVAPTVGGAHGAEHGFQGAMGDEQTFQDTKTILRRGKLAGKSRVGSGEYKVFGYQSPEYLRHWQSHLVDHSSGEVTREMARSLNDTIAAKADNYTKLWKRAEKTGLSAGAGSTEAMNVAQRLRAEAQDTLEQSVLRTAKRWSPDMNTEAAGLTRLREGVVSAEQPLRPEVQNELLSILRPRFGDRAEAVASWMTDATRAQMALLHGSNMMPLTELIHDVANASITPDTNLLGVGRAQMKIFGTKADKIPPVQDAKGALNDLFGTMDKREQGFFPTRVAGETSLPVSKGIINGLTEPIYRNVFGKMLNFLSRQPHYLLEFTDQMKALQPLIDEGRITEDQAIYMAQVRSTREMVKYVHNPSDRSHVSEMIRGASPFFFAQEQALRRAGRLLFRDPAAFERYARTLVQAENFATAETQHNGNNYFLLPGSTVIGTGVSTVLQLVGASAMGTIPMGLTGSLDSLKSVDPFGVQSNGQQPSFMGSVGAAITPSFGPLAAIPMKALQNLFGEHAPAVSNAIAGIEGPVASNEPAWMQFIPNSLLQHVFEGVSGTLMANPSASRNMFDSSFFTTLLDVMQAAAVNHPEMFQHPLNPTESAKLVAMARNQTALMWAAKTFIGYVSPISLSLSSGEPFLSQQLQDDIARAHGNVIAGQQAFLKKYPFATPLTTYHTVAADGFTAFPETQGAMSFLQYNKATLAKYPYAARYLLTPAQSSGAFSEPSLALQLADGLRQENTPEELIKNMYINVGNVYYYNTLLPAINNLYNTLPKAEAYATSQSWLQSAALANPEWGAYKAAGQSALNAAMTVGELQQMLKDPTVNNAWIMPVVADMLGHLQGFQNEYNQAYSSQDKYNVQQQWYADCTKAAAAYPDYAPLLTEVFRRVKL